MKAKQDCCNVLQPNPAKGAYLQTPSRPRRTLPVAKHRQEAVSSPADAAGSGPRRTLPASSSGCTRSTWPPPLASATLENREESKISAIVSSATMSCGQGAGAENGLQQRLHPQHLSVNVRQRHTE